MSKLSSFSFEAGGHFHEFCTDGKGHEIPERNYLLSCSWLGCCSVARCSVPHLLTKTPIPLLAYRDCDCGRRRHPGKKNKSILRSLPLLGQAESSKVNETRKPTTASVPQPHLHASIQCGRQRIFYTCM